MQREPSIHITKSKLQSIISDMFQPDSGIDVEGITNIIFAKAKAHSIHTRSITVSNERMERKAKRLLSSSRRDADLLAQLIYHKRKRMKHRGISPIKTSGREWDTIKEIAAHALDFTNEFNLARRYGFSKYVEIALSKMKKFNLNKFTPMYQGICETYQAILEIEGDDDRELTYEMFRSYIQKVSNVIGTDVKIYEAPEQYVWFVRARQQAEQMNVSVIVYIDAQFKGLDFTDKSPHPTQLVGDKAKERLIRYCYEEGIRIQPK